MSVSVEQNGGKPWRQTSRTSWIWRTRQQKGGGCGTLRCCVWFYVYNVMGLTSPILEALREEGYSTVLRRIERWELKTSQNKPR